MSELDGELMDAVYEAVDTAIAQDEAAEADGVQLDLAEEPDKGPEAGEALQSKAQTEDDLDSEDSLTFSNGVIEKIVAIAMREVPGVVGMKGGWINRIQDAFGASDARKGVSVEVTPESAVRVNVSVLIEYGAYAPQVFEDVKHAIVKQVTGMTGLQVAGVNLRIEDVLTAEEVAARNKAATDAETLQQPEDQAAEPKPAEEGPDA